MSKEFIENLYAAYSYQIPYDFEENQLGFPRGDENRGRYSDISAHLPMLHFIGKQSSSVVEIGTRECYSTSAFLRSGADVWSIDLNINEMIKLIQKEVPQWTFIQGDSVQVHRDKKFDTLFIDGLHTATQVEKELEEYKESVCKFIVFHDTAIGSQGINSKDIEGEAGVLGPILEFVEKNPQWEVVYQCEFNHGLLIIQRTS